MGDLAGMSPPRCGRHWGVDQQMGHQYLFVSLLSSQAYILLLNHLAMYLQGVMHISCFSVVNSWVFSTWCFSLQVSVAIFQENVSLCETLMKELTPRTQVGKGGFLGAWAASSMTLWFPAAAQSSGAAVHGAPGSARRLHQAAGRTAARQLFQGSQCLHLTLQPFTNGASSTDSLLTAPNKGL